MIIYLFFIFPCLIPRRDGGTLKLGGHEMQKETRHSRTHPRALLKISPKQHFNYTFISYIIYITHTTILRMEALQSTPRWSEPSVGRHS